ncbi:MAG: hypothetical protein RBT76_00785 [candidate division Zixibacteria bacterium]|jgi:hypothetical protein|nr:hypothetical protein [candidate division Zixibacteria bacterium]
MCRSLTRNFNLGSKRRPRYLIAPSSDSRTRTGAFDRQYDAVRSFDSIADVVTIRRVVSLDKAEPFRPEQITGPADRIAWLRDRWI